MYNSAYFIIQIEQREIIQNNDLVYKTDSKTCVLSILYKIKYAFYERGVCNWVEIKKFLLPLLFFANILKNVKKFW